MAAGGERPEHRVVFFTESALEPSDPENRPVLILGQVENLKRVDFSRVNKYLSHRVDEETWSKAISSLNNSSGDTCSLWLKKAAVASIPNKCSRHNTPSAAHVISKVVDKNAQRSGIELIIIVCSRANLYASGLAAARPFPHYNMKTNRSSSDNNGRSESILVYMSPDASDPPLSADEAHSLNIAIKGMRLAQMIVDAPCSEMNTTRFVKEIREVGEELGIKPMVISGEELKVKGFGGIYGVGKAAAHPPALAVLSHTPPGATKTIAWCGKGIVYDTGGLSLKDKLFMVGMKRDCGGAAGILGAFYTAVKLGFKENLHAVFCLAENAIGPGAARPDDVHTLYSGKTVEINNTDAEGRLVLGDGVMYARKDLGADIVLDMCTLTGAQGISTGRYHGAVMTNNEEWEDKAFEAGRTSGDLVFPIVYAPELHYQEFSSVLADMKNSVKDRSNAQSSCAGLFIGSHLGFDYPGVWVHVDMAYPVYSGERATGYGVGLLTTLFGTHSESHLLQSVAPDMQGEGVPTPKRKKP
jgi:probable aminopeptidase NPEPL1